MDQTLAKSRDAIEKGSSSFNAAATLFDRQTREDAWFLYAWCRYCDDQIDGQDLGHGVVDLSVDQRRSRLADLVARTEAAVAGRPTRDPTFDALQRVVRRADLSPLYPMELLDGMAMDVEGARYDTLEDTLTYCWHVAGVVGVMMAHVMGVRDLATLRRAQDLGLAMQMTNIARDAIDDARVGRIYLPAAWLSEAGVAATMGAVAASQNRVAVHRVVLRLLDQAEPYYDSAREGLTALPFRSALAVAAARAIYRQIGRKLRREGPNAWRRRVRVSTPMKLWLFVQAMGVVLASRRRRETPRPELWSKL